MCVFVSRPMNIVTFLRKTVRPQNGFLIFLGKETNSETQSWKSSRILTKQVTTTTVRVKPNFFIFSLCIIYRHFFVFFHFFTFQFFLFFLIFLHVSSFSFITTLPHHEPPAHHQMRYTHVFSSRPELHVSTVRLYSCALKSLLHHCQVIAQRGCYDSKQ